jgi:hypothetical protein
VVRDGRWGFIDKSGQVQIDFTYQQARRFEEGLAAVQQGGVWGFIDRQGTMRIQPRYQAIYWRGFIDGRASVLINGLWGSINRQGELVVPSLFDSPVVFSPSGLSRIRKDERFGYIGRDGQIVIRPIYTHAQPFSEGLAAVQVGGEWIGRRVRGGSWGYIDARGEMIITPQFAYADGFSEGFAAVHLRAGGSGPRRFGGYIDRTGRVVLDGEDYSAGQAFSEGLAVVRDRTTGLWGAINTDGERVISADYARLEPFHEGLAAVLTYHAPGTSDRPVWGYLNKDDQMVIPPAYTRAGPFEQGLAEVWVDDKRGYIDQAGQVIWPPSR